MKVLLQWWVLLLVVSGLLFGCGQQEKNLENGVTEDARPGSLPGSVREAMFDWLEDKVDCLSDKGWKVKLDYVDYSFSGIPQEQFEQYQADSAECDRLLGPAPNMISLTPEYANRIFDHLVQMKSCLENLGYQISDPPSRAEFVDSYLHYDGINAPWSPHNDVASVTTSEEWRNVLMQCPQDIDNELKIAEKL